MKALLIFIALQSFALYAVTLQSIKNYSSDYAVLVDFSPPVMGYDIIKLLSGKLSRSYKPHQTIILGAGAHRSKPTTLHGKKQVLFTKNRMSPLTEIPENGSLIIQDESHEVLPPAVPLKEVIVT